MVLENTLEIFLDFKEMKSNSKGNQLWIFIGSSLAEAPVIFSLDVKSWLIGKYLDAGKDWGQEEKRVAEDEMIGCCCSVAQPCLTLCDPTNGSTPGFPVLHCLPEFAQIHVHWVSKVIQPFHPLLPPSPLALNLSQHQGLSNESALLIRWPYWTFSFNISPSNKHRGQISFRMDCLDHLAVQGTLKSLFQHHSAKASIQQYEKAKHL